MDAHRVEERFYGVIEDRRPIRLVDVLVAQKVDKVARIEPVKSVEEHVEAILEVDELALLDGHRMIRPSREIVENLEQIGQKGAYRCGDDGQKCDDAQQSGHKDCDIALELKSAKSHQNIDKNGAK